MPFQKGNTLAKGKGRVQRGGQSKGTKIIGGIYIPSQYQQYAHKIDAWIREYDSMASFLVAMWEEHHLR